MEYLFPWTRLENIGKPFRHLPNPEFLENNFKVLR